MSRTAAAMLALFLASPPAFAVPTLSSTVTSSVAGLSTGCDLSGVTSGSLTATCSGGDFSAVSITASGPPLLPGPDLSATSLTVSSSGPATLTVGIASSGFSFPGGPVSALLTVNNLIGGDAGPFTLTAFTPAGSLTHTFTGSGTDTLGPINLGAFTTDAADFTLAFTGAGQSIDATIEIIGAIPEPGSLALLGVGLLGLGWLTRGPRRGWRAAGS
jgi:PEP-CTERM motif-containing protein